MGDCVRRGRARVGSGEVKAKVPEWTVGAESTAEVGDAEVIEFGSCGNMRVGYGGVGAEGQW